MELAGIFYRRIKDLLLKIFNNLIHLMKKNSILIFFSLAFFHTIHAQHNVFSAGATQTLTITNGTIFSADSLVLIPTGSFTIASNALLETPVAVPGFPTNSISRVYYLNNPVTFTGSILIYYQLSELNGNTESSLQYSDSTNGGWWLDYALSTDNSTSHFVTQPASSDMFVVATATQNGTVLLLKLLSFTGSWNGNYTRLTWTIDENEDSKNFTVETSADGLDWQSIAVVPASLIEGQYTYNYNDGDADFTTKFYRIKITELSGQISYSSIIKISKGNLINNAYVVGGYNEATIYFTGMQPRVVRVMNSSGQIIWVSNTVSNQYELNNLLAGVYFVQYEVNGITAAKQFVVR
jgi:hypothetical protein